MEFLLLRTVPIVPIVLALANAASAQCGSWADDFSSNGMDDYVGALLVHDDGSGPALYAAGGFDQAGPTRAHHVAKWDGTGWSPLGLGTSGDILALSVYDDGSGPALFATGIFWTAGGSSADHVAKWDGAGWSPLGSGLTGGGGTIPLYGSSLGIYDDGSGPALYVGGSFFGAGGVPANNIARWDGANWTALGSGVSGAHVGVHALLAYDDGTGPALYVGGIFATAGGSTANGIARWNGTSWSSFGNGTNDPYGGVFALAVYDDGSGPALYAGGSFTAIAGTAADNIARWDGAAWSAVGAGVGGGVGALCVHDDGSGSALYVSGSFTTAGGTRANHIAKWNGTSWAALGTGLNQGAGALAEFDDGSDADADLYAGGLFTTSGGLAAGYIAEWQGCGTETYCFGDGTLPTACPCGNTGATGHGCENSEGTGGAVLAASGSHSPDTVVLTASGERASAFTIFLQGTASLPNGLRFGDGVRCAGGSLKRLYKRSAGGGVVLAPDFGAGEPSITARSAALGDVLLPGSTRYYQTYYRDPSPTFCPNPPGNTWNASSGVKIRW
jgi:hypothetical protein